MALIINILNIAGKCYSIRPLTWQVHVLQLFFGHKIPSKMVRGKDFLLQWMYNRFIHVVMLFPSPISDHNWAGTISMATA